MAVNAALVAVLVPASVCLGFAAATISFTAWNIIVPLLLNGFGLPLANTRTARRRAARAMRTQEVTLLKCLACAAGAALGAGQCSFRSCWTCSTARCSRSRTACTARSTGGSAACLAPSVPSSPRWCPTSWSTFWPSTRYGHRPPPAGAAAALHGLSTGGPPSAARRARPQSFLKGIMYVVPFGLSIGFCAKGIIVWRRRRRQQAAQVRGGAHGPALVCPHRR